MVELARPPSDPVRVALTAHGANTARTGNRLVSKDIRIPSVLYEERPLYACRGVDHPWPVEPTERTLKAFELHEGQWLLIAGHERRRAGELSPMLNNPNVEVLFGSAYVKQVMPNAMCALMDGKFSGGGGSLWYGSNRSGLK